MWNVWYDIPIKRKIRQQNIQGFWRFLILDSFHLSETLNKNVEMINMIYLWKKNLHLKRKKVSRAVSIKIQKQPSRGALRKRCSENMQQIYRRTSMPKCDFNKVTKQICWNHTSAWMSSCKFAAYFQNIFPWEHLCRAASENSWIEFERIREQK